MAAHGDDDDDVRTLVSIGGVSENAIERAAERENATPPPTPTRGNVRTRSRSRLERDPPPPPPSPDMRDTTTPEREDEETNNTDTSGDPVNALTPTEQLTNQTKTVYWFVGSIYLLHLGFCVLAKLFGWKQQYRMLIQFRCVAFYSASYWFVRAFYCESVQNWLRNNTRSRFLRKMFANGATFYGETVGTPTKWSQALAIFFLNAASCNGVRMFVLALFTPDEYMPGLAGVCLIQCLFHMGLIRMHSMLNAVHTVANFITQTILHPTAAHHATLIISVIPAMLMNNLLCGANYRNVHWNLVVKILADGFWYTLRLFIVRDPLLTLVGKPSDNNLEQYVLQHLMESMLSDFVLTMYVAFFCGGNETVIFWWTAVDFFVQFLSFFVLAVVAFKAEKLGIKALELDNDWEKKKRNCVDTCLKFLIMSAHLTYLPLNWAAYMFGVGAVIVMIHIIWL